MWCVPRKFRRSRRYSRCVSFSNGALWEEDSEGVYKQRMSEMEEFLWDELNGVLSAVAFLTMVLPSPKLLAMVLALLA